VERISAVICAKDEEDNIAACIGCLEGVDEIVIADGGSTDRTREIAESLGARTFARKDHSILVTKKDVAAFKKRFGWDSALVAGERIGNGQMDSREAVAAAKFEWVVMPDADERVSWDLPRLRAEVLPIADQIISQFVHAHDENGDPIRVSTITKMFRKTHGRIEGRTHQVLLPEGRCVSTDLMRIDHWQKPKPNRQNYVRAIMEYSVLKEDDQRSRFYLGREYYYYREYDKALELLDLYLANATWQPEIAQARPYAARCYWESGRGDEARKSCLEAVLLNPMHKEALALMAELYYEPWSHKWAQLAVAATDEDILF
jgi:glycosyltransferase involved in cell wall biosynthesis